MSISVTNLGSLAWNLGPRKPPSLLADLHLASVTLPLLLFVYNSSEDARLVEGVQSLVERVWESYDNCEFGKGIESVMSCLHQVSL